MAAAVQMFFFYFSDVKHSERVNRGAGFTAGLLTAE